MDGEVTVADLLDGVTTAVSDPRFERGFDVFSDHTEIEKVISPAQVHSLVDHLQKASASLAGARWAIVTVKPASYGMMRMLAVYAERVPMEIRVFLSHDEAEQWLATPKRPTEVV